MDKKKKRVLAFIGTQVRVLYNVEEKQLEIYYHRMMNIPNFEEKQLVEVQEVLSLTAQGVGELYMCIAELHTTLQEQEQEDVN